MFKLLNRINGKEYRAIITSDNKRIIVVNLWHKPTGTESKSITCVICELCGNVISPYSLHHQTLKEFYESLREQIK